MTYVRKATVSGMFYDAEKKRLQNQIQHCFLSEFGPGLIHEIGGKTPSVKAVIVPHAGYPFSGSIAAFSYNMIAATGLADVFIILGPNHQGRGSGVAMSSEGIWTTPLGEIPIDESMVGDLKGGLIDPDDSTMSNQENSIEVQLPFLQFIAKDHPFSIVPIAMLLQEKETAKTLGTQLAEVIQKQKRRVVLIASTDFSHEGHAYGRMPPEPQQAHEYVTAQDEMAIQKITEMDPDGLVDTVYENNISMCGYGPVATMLWASKHLGATSVELLKYGTSYDVHPDSSACVGYASFAVY